ncbi:hypothetical protein N8199_07940 [Emcibacteraceae bacterium]|nr:hypothetical protein [Emcibacteraceae bacterium]MDC1429812.1 hypothetical protein [Emcibacteraceae bacterium]
MRRFVGSIGSKGIDLQKKLPTDYNKSDVLQLNLAGALQLGTIGRISWSVDEDDQVSFVVEPKAPPMTYQRQFFVNSNSLDSQ